MNIPECIIVHHSGGTDANPRADTSNQTAEIIRQWHLEQGWSDIGYHWVIEKSGKVVKGRDEKSTGAHCIGWNNKSIGVCVVGNFDVTMPTPAQIEALIGVLRGIMARHGISYTKIYPHRRFANKTCYGRKLSDTWASDLIKNSREEIVMIPCPKSKVDIVKNFLNSLK